MKEVTIECNGFIPTLPDNTTYKTSFKEIIINGISPQPLNTLGWRQQWDEAPKITCEAFTSLGSLFYQSGFKRIDSSFWDGLPNITKIEAVFNAWWGKDDLSDILNESGWFDKKPKITQIIDIKNQDGGYRHISKSLYEPIGKQLVKFRFGGFNNGGTRTIDKDFFSIFDLNVLRSVENCFSGSYNLNPLPEIWKDIPLEKCVSIKDEASDLSNIPEGKINVYSVFIESEHKDASNWSEVPDIFKDTYVPPNK